MIMVNIFGAAVFILALVLLPITEGQAVSGTPATTFVPRPLCNFQMALANSACAYLPFVQISPPSPRPPFDDDDDNDRGKRRRHRRRHRRVRDHDEHRHEHHRRERAEDPDHGDHDDHDHDEDDHNVYVDCGFIKILSIKSWNLSFFLHSC
ncbi:hypothetical protein CTI12_AA297410 [Artemisia annua]|uniref:Uncharacterized protein n=1 Tax=Artemisia annua TaxID=35608 RepID=A0A2U1N7C2_ARTAN|nr:hypothetical protein CTI12_AA297410 [Artemisia annua]